MGKIKNLILSLSLAAGDEWQVAYRKCDNKKLYEENISKPFFLLKNRFRYWYADPFVFKYNNTNYLFCEMYDRFKRKGVIGVTEFNDYKNVKFKICLETNFHLSYPCIYEHNGDIYMIPESYQSKKVIIYKCISFPYKWEEYKVLSNGYFADTTPFIKEDTVMFFTTAFSTYNSRSNNNLHLLDDKGNAVKLLDNDYTCRSAGLLIYKNGSIIRPTQNCFSTYGENLVFKKVLLDDDYSEIKLFSVYPPNRDCCYSINIHFPKDEYHGLHTYNSNDDYEFVDIKLKNQRSFIYFVQNLYKYLIIKIKRK